MMKTFKQFMAEADDGRVVSTQREVSGDLSEPRVLDELNRYLAQVTGSGFVNPYMALEQISQTLSTYGITIPQVQYLPEPAGEKIFKVQQFGEHHGYSSDFASRMDDDPLHVYFSYQIDKKGIYEVFCVVVNKDGVNTIMGEEVELDDKFPQGPKHPNPSKLESFETKDGSDFWKPKPPRKPIKVVKDALAKIRKG